MADDWKYAVEDFEDDDGGADATNGDDAAGGRATDVFGEASSGTIEPGSPSFENTLFVLLGVAIAVLVLLGV